MARQGKTSGYLLASLQQLRNRVLQNLSTCRVAQSEAERRGIARLRYEIYAKEQNLSMEGTDHDRQEMWHPEDDDPRAIHIYAGSADHVLGSLRLRVWPPGAVPEREWAAYSMDLLPDMSRRVITEVAKLMVHPSRRGSLSMASLTSFSVDHAIRFHGVETMVAFCVPGLLRHYQRLGLRHFGGRLLSTGRGVVIPLIGLSCEIDHVFRIGSPWYPSLRRLQQEGKLPEDLPHYREQILRDRSVISDPKEVRAELRALQGAGRSPFLQDLPAEALSLLSDNGMILDVPAQLAICREGVADLEVYLVLEGTFEVERGGAARALVQPGQVFGEAALFSRERLRTATVQSKTKGRVFVMRRRFLSTVMETDPRLGWRIYQALIRELVRKLT